RYRVSRALVRIELADQGEHRYADRNAQLPSEPRRSAGVDPSRVVEARVDADPGHVHQSVARNDPGPARGGLVLVADHDQAIGPAPGHALDGQVCGVRQGATRRVEMEAVRGVGDGGTSVGWQSANGEPRQEARDRGVDMDDVGLVLEDRGEGATRARQPADVTDRP